MELFILTAIFTGIPVFVFVCFTVSFWMLKNDIADDDEPEFEDDIDRIVHVILTAYVLAREPWYILGVVPELTIDFFRRLGTGKIG